MGVIPVKDDMLPTGTHAPNAVAVLLFPEVSKFWIIDDEYDDEDEYSDNHDDEYENGSKL